MSSLCQLNILQIGGTIPKQSSSQPVSPPNGEIRSTPFWLKSGTATGNRSNVAPIKYNTVGRNVDDSWLNKGNFWST